MTRKMQEEKEIKQRQIPAWKSTSPSLPFISKTAANEHPQDEGKEGKVLYSHLFLTLIRFLHCKKKLEGKEGKADHRSEDKEIDPQTILETS